MDYVAQHRCFSGFPRTECEREQRWKRADAQAILVSSSLPVVSLVKDWASCGRLSIDCYLAGAAEAMYEDVTSDVEAVERS